LVFEPSKFVWLPMITSAPAFETCHGSAQRQ